MPNSHQPYKTPNTKNQTLDEFVLRKFISFISFLLILSNKIHGFILALLVADARQLVGGFRNAGMLESREAGKSESL
jgi:hypothetical protein